MPRQPFGEPQIVQTLIPGPKDVSTIAAELGIKLHGYPRSWRRVGRPSQIDHSAAPSSKIADGDLVAGILIAIAIHSGTTLLV